MFVDLTINNFNRNGNGNHLNIYIKEYEIPKNVWFPFSSLKLHSYNISNLDIAYETNKIYPLTLNTKIL